MMMGPVLIFTLSFVILIMNLLHLVKKIPETTLVRKIMRSLPDRFSSKVIAIEEVKDLDSIKVKHLMDSLHAFEMTLKQRKKKNKEKSIALKVMHEEEDSIEEDNEDELALLTKNFKFFFKKVGKSFKSGSSFSNAFKGKNSSTPKNSIFPNNKKRYNVGNVKVSSISNPSVQTLRKRKI